MTSLDKKECQKKHLKKIDDHTKTKERLIPCPALLAVMLKKLKMHVR